MPGVYSKNKFDLAGFSVGIVSKKILQNRVKKKDTCNTFKWYTFKWLLFSKIYIKKK